MATVVTAADFAKVREDERLDEKSLQQYLKDRLPGADRPMEVFQFVGGSSNLTYLIRLGDEEWVLRRPPKGPVAPSASDMNREFRILSRLWQVFHPAPRAYFFCEDVSIVGAPFYVMERRRGTLIKLRQPLPPDFANRPPEVYRRFSEEFIDGLADLHGVDYKAIGLENFGRPVGFLERQITGWTGRWERAKTRELPEMERLGAWFLANMPTAQSATILHNDYFVHNVLIGENGGLSAILDWEMASLGDPLIDLGITLNYWRQPDDAPELLAISKGYPHTAITPGFLTRDEMAQRYARRSGRDISTLPYYIALGFWKYATVCEQLYLRHVRGLSSDPRYLDFEPAAPALAHAAAAMAAEMGFRQ